MEKHKEIILADRNHSFSCLVANMTEELYQKASQTGNRKVVTAIGGYTGLGKGILAKSLAESVGDSVILPTDSFMLDRATKRSLGLTGDEENAFNFDLLTETIINLIHNKPALVKPYDHSIGVFKDPIVLHLSKHIIIEGTASLYPRLHSFLDLSYFMDADEKTRNELARKVYISERG